ncbi:hypothetical protein CIB84_007944 [Bambusicola thoracicus]|uniref:Ciliary microtubule inner protein 2A-C-like domain-containing protein n=1 Tax=Bambusicola thoracicus TaxID=9083 RepID=A0A2P4SW06_BAMTH|nr:hypothetical protein CIB84_007944 [Bambusicola thoracicus]
MAAPRQSALFPPHPHHIPGSTRAPCLCSLSSYEGFLPQYNYQFGETYGKTTYRLLTDPHIRRSPRSVLAPLCKPRFIEDCSGTQHGLQPFLPAHPGFFLNDRARALTNIPEAEFGPKPPAPGPAEEDLMHMEPQHGHGGSGLSRCPPSAAWDPSGPPQEQEWRLPPISAACGHGRWHRAGAAAGTGQVRLWVGGCCVYRSSFCFAEPYTTRVPSPSIGYSGFVPRFRWAMGTNYLQGVKEAMAEFDRQQLLERNPLYSFGKRFPQTYWPGSSIYTSTGLIPAYKGFVPRKFIS